MVLITEAMCERPTRIAARLTRILAGVRFASRATGRDTWKRRILSLGIRPWVRQTFLRVCRNELDVLSTYR